MQTCSDSILCNCISVSTRLRLGKFTWWWNIQHVSVNHKNTVVFTSLIPTVEVIFPIYIAAHECIIKTQMTLTQVHFCYVVF